MKIALPAFRLLPGLPLVRLRQTGWVLLLVLAFGAGVGGRAAAAEPGTTFDEYQVKAAFLLNFIRFVNWPAEAFSSDEDPIVVGILGGQELGRSLEPAVQQERIQGRAVILMQSRRLEELKQCHILFVSKSESRRTADILSACRAGPVLTVGETSGFAEKGGVINFIRRGTRIQFEINPEAAKAKGIKISSRLLRLAHIAGK